MFTHLQIVFIDGEHAVLTVQPLASIPQGAHETNLQRPVEVIEVRA